MSDIPQSLKQALSGRYELSRIIGRGGMATVYQAHDVRHHREVAIKVMRQDLASALGTERFLREIRISAGLSHPNIVTLIESDEIDDHLFYVMPYIEGESLRERLRTCIRLDHATALAITTEVADALGYAHRKDVVHRDIKPENILLTEGHAVVTDFGIAKAITRASDEHLTRTGFPLGTVGYMSPEQAAGGSDLSPASDVFSLACVCYEMLVGTSPNRWITEEERLLGRFVDCAPEHRKMLDGIPGYVEGALITAMAMSPSSRFETPGEFAAALVEPVPDQRYRTREVADIIRRAADMEAESDGTGDGMSLTGVERLGAEVGIAPDLVRRAARPSEVRVESSRQTGVFGWPRTLEAQRSVRGEVFGHDYSAALEDIRAVIREPGHAGTFGKTFEWRTTNAGMTGARDVQVMITPKGGRTQIRAVESLQLKPVAAGIGGFQTALLIAGSTVALTTGTIWIMPAVLVGGLLLVFGARNLWDRTTAHKEAELAELVNRLADRMLETRSRV